MSRRSGQALSGLNGPTLPPHPHSWDCLVLVLAAAPEREKGRERVTSWALSPPAPSARGEASQVEVISAHQGLGGKAARTPALPPNALLILTWELVSDTCWSLRGISASATHPRPLQPHKFKVDRKRERMAEPDGGMGEVFQVAFPCHVLNAVACFGNSGIRGASGATRELGASIPPQPPSMALSLLEAKADTWEKWTLTPSPPPAGTDRNRHLLWEKNIYLGKQ